jgi:hypothetical protein
MFVSEHQLLKVGLGAAQSRLVNLASRDGLSVASQQAYEGGLEHLVRVGPLGDVPGISKQVKVRFIEPAYRDDGMTLGVRWEATGVAGGLFPVFDGDVTLTSVDEHTTQLALVGSYRPPLGGIGTGLDKAILSKVADATIKTLLRSIATALVQPDSVAGTYTERPSGQLQRLDPEPEEPPLTERPDKPGQVRPCA